MSLQLLRKLSKSSHLILTLMSVTGDLKQSPFLTLPPDITALVNTNEKEEKKKTTVIFVESRLCYWTWSQYSHLYFLKIWFLRRRMESSNTIIIKVRGNPMSFESARTMAQITTTVARCLAHKDWPRYFLIVRKT